MPRPQPGSFPDFFQNYISKVKADNIAEAADRYGTSVVDFFKNIPAEKASYKYAEGKWSLKEMLLHLIDAERIFAYRALCIARKDQTPLPGFDENLYATNSKADNRNWDDLITEFEITRKSTDMLIKSFDEEQLQQQGITSNVPNTVNAICYVVYGHILHHVQIVKERYLTD
ncbi:MAG TPA: DinB family protein [Segetibacter sp.]|jgi:uncharacterized damage-inducible protein DinB